METGEWEKMKRERGVGKRKREHEKVEMGRCKLGRKRCPRKAGGQRKTYSKMQIGRKKSLRTL